MDQMRWFFHGRVGGRWTRFISASVLLIGLFLLTGCNLQQIGPQDFSRQTEVRATELELHVQQTLISQQATAQGPAMTRQADLATRRAQEALTAQPPRLQPTLQRVIQPTATDTPPTSTEPPTLAPTETPAGLDESQLQERVKTAHILVYEDMVIRNNTNRYVKDTLMRMGLAFKDDGNATGWLADDLQKGAPGGGPWDLVIIALEDKVGTQSGFFNYALQALDAGSSVILETWFFNTTYQGGGRLILERCGVAYMGNRIKLAPSNMTLYAMDPSNPILNTPNAGLQFSKTNDYWWDSTGRVDYDTGDLLKLSSGSQAKLVIGAKPDTPEGYATVAVCEDGRLILQAFSSHTLTYDTMTLLWENYIYNALKARFEAAQ